MTPLRVELGDRSYDIRVGRGLLREAGALIRAVAPAPRAFVVTDRTVAKLHLPTLEDSLRAAGFDVATFALPPGEASKDFAHLEQVIDAMLAARCERSTSVLALGGGVVGDIAGFAASILLRGVPFVQIPTTLLAQVDSSVGGKTAIDTRHGKNLVGSFYQPRLVVADVATLATLPEREMRAGYAEVVKTALLGDADFFVWLETHGAAVIGGDADALAHAVRTSCAAKARIVAADERESGPRALLNLGHTFAHALEKEAGYDGSLLHGEAVSIGLLMAFALSVRLGLAPPADAERLRRHLRGLGMPLSPPPLLGRRWDAARLLTHMASDKKVSDGRVTFVLATRIGAATLRADVAPGDAIAAMEEVLE